MLLSIAASLGALAFRRISPLPDEARDNCNVVQDATITLMALLIGCRLSMAISCYNQRKKYEEEEANAVNSEYLRADLVGVAGSVTIKPLLARYVQLRTGLYSGCLDQPHPALGMGLDDLDCLLQQPDAGLCHTHQNRTPRAAARPSVYSFAIAFSDRRPR